MREDWIEVELGEVFQTVTGTTPSKKEIDNYGSFLPFIKPPDINNEIINTVSEYLSEKGKNKSRILPKNSVLVTCIGNLGRIGINKTEIAFNQQINAILPIKEIAPKFIFFQAQSINFRNQLEALSTSTTVALVNKSSFNTIRIEIAPLPIQRAIVRKIENLFASLDKGIADLKTAQEQLKVYRQAVLKKAFEGRFGSAQRPSNNLKDGELPEGWKWVKLGEVIDKITAGKSFRCDERTPMGDEVGILKVSALTWGEFLQDESKTVTDVSKINKNYFVKKGDFLLSRANTIELVGNSVIVKHITKTLMLSDKTLKIDFLESLNSWYVLYFLRTRKGRTQIENLSTGNQESMRNIGQERIKQIFIPLPPTLSEQHAIVREIESRLSVCDKVEQDIALAIERSRNLRQSILKKAFEGRLLSEAEVTKCKQEADYEPASVLLERIERSRNERIKKEKHGK